MVLRPRILRTAVFVLKCRLYCRYVIFERLRVPSKTFGNVAPLYFCPVLGVLWSTLLNYDLLTVDYQKLLENQTRSSELAFGLNYFVEPDRMSMARYFR